jgi:hypothetical protein
MDKNRNKMYCLIYRLRKRGVRIDTKDRMIFVSWEMSRDAKHFVSTPAVCRLRKEFHFVVQLEIGR